MFCDSWFSWTRSIMMTVTKLYFMPINIVNKMVPVIITCSLLWLHCSDKLFKYFSFMLSDLCRSRNKINSYQNQVVHPGVAWQLNTIQTKSTHDLAHLAQQILSDGSMNHLNFWLPASNFKMFSPNISRQMCPSCTLN